MIAHIDSEKKFTSPSTLVSISGSGNVAQYAALKCIELGATVISLSDSKGALVRKYKDGQYEGKGLTKEIVEKVQAIKAKGGLLSSVHVEGYEFVEGQLTALFSFDVYGINTDALVDSS